MREYTYKSKQALSKMSIGMLRGQIIAKGGSYEQDMGKESLVNRLWSLGNGSSVTIKFGV